MLMGLVFAAFYIKICVVVIAVNTRYLSLRAVCAPLLRFVGCGQFGICFCMNMHMRFIALLLAVCEKCLSLSWLMSERDVKEVIYMYIAKTAFMYTLMLDIYAWMFELHMSNAAGALVWGCDRTALHSTSCVTVL